MTGRSRPVLLFGHRGQLGSEFAAVLGRNAVVGADRDDLDISDTTKLRALALGVRPHLIINCAAWNDVDGAETHALDAVRMNAVVPGALAEIARDLDATLVHFSSDFVFDGTSREPYCETDAPNPVSIYGMSKLLGEVGARSAPKHYILRLSSLFGGAQRRSYVDRIVAALQSGEGLPVFVDRIVTPSYAPHVVEATLGLIEAEAPAGLYHCVATGVSNWLGLAQEIGRQMDGDLSLLREVPFANSPSGAQRPRFCALSNDKLASQIGRPAHWQDAVREHLSRRWQLAQSY
jgi:dTDP-4-dehydrorhamnose reductase